MKNIILLISFMVPFLAYGMQGMCTSGDNNKKVVMIPTVDKVKKDIVNREFIERTQSGWFKDVKWKINEDDKIIVKVNKRTLKNNILVYYIDVELTTPSRAIYDIKGEMVYALVNNKWKPDFFSCYKVMPRITGRYDKYIVAKLDKSWGDSILELRNYCDINLAVGVRVKFKYKDGMQKFSVVVKPDEPTVIGGVFTGQVDYYEIHYIERR